MKRTTLVAAVAALTAGCSADPRSEAVAEVPAADAELSAPAPRITATAPLVDARGANVGQVVLTRRDDGVGVSVHVQGLPAGEHAIHLHQVGSCTPPDFLSSGGHFNPSGRAHGLENPEGPHDGDLRNITLGEDGSGHFELRAEGVSLADGPTPLLDADGAAVVIHAGPDDYRTGPTGERGMERIACASFDG